MAVVENLGNQRKAKYKVTFLRGRREQNHIEILETVEAKDAKEALKLAFGIAEKAKWHIEKVERLNC
jgi:hypothetical protein